MGLRLSTTKHDYDADPDTEVRGFSFRSDDTFMRYMTAEVVDETIVMRGSIRGARDGDKAVAGMDEFSIRINGRAARDLLTALLHNPVTLQHLCEGVDHLRANETTRADGTVIVPPPHKSPEQFRIERDEMWAKYNGAMASIYGDAI